MLTAQDRYICSIDHLSLNLSKMQTHQLPQNLDIIYSAVPSGTKVLSYLVPIDR